MGFAERNGFLQEKSIQIDNMDIKLRNRLFNLIHRVSKDSPFIDKELNFVVDRLGWQVESTLNMNWKIIDSVLNRNISDIPWYMPYEVIELFFEAKRYHCKKCEFKSDSECNYCDYTMWYRNVTNDTNKILEQEKSGYRLLNDKFVNIVNSEELEEVSTAMCSPYQPVRTHIDKALSLYADRKKPDYENSIKESISAVEALCCIITGATGSQATLGNTLKKLESDGGIVIHGAMKTAFEKLYGYTSDSDGIRHGGIDFRNAPAEDAKYMLVSCSAFINYLIEKQSKQNT